MTAGFRIFPRYNLIVTTFRDVVTTDEYVEVYRELTSNPDFTVEQVELVDFAAVTELRLEAQEIRTFASRVGERYREDRVLTAMICSSDATFGLARMYQAFAELAGAETVQVFRERAPALEWLGLSDLPPDVLDVPQRAGAADEAGG